jgi:hypothetical protein
MKQPFAQDMVTVLLLILVNVLLDTLEQLVQLQVVLVSLQIPQQFVLQKVTVLLQTIVFAFQIILVAPVMSQHAMG